MPHDPARVVEARAWLQRAAQDLRAAELDRTGSPPLTGDIVFHCQQLAEKAMKAFLSWHDRPFRKTHNLIELGMQCVAIDAGLQPVLARAAVLTEYAWKFRYPGEFQEPPIDEANDALLRAREVYEAILGRLPGEVRI